MGFLLATIVPNEKYFMHIFASMHKSVRLGWVAGIRLIVHMWYLDLQRGQCLQWGVFLRILTRIYGSFGKTREYSEKIGG